MKAPAIAAVPYSKPCDRHATNTSAPASDAAASITGQILVLDGGRIAERGTHDELIKNNGLYAELHEKQLLEEELAAS